MAPFARSNSRQTTIFRSAVEKDIDVSIRVPYDAAARLAYDEWRQEFNKGDFNPERYINFKKNYEAVTVANVTNKKRARDTGMKEPPKIMTLNEYGDYSLEEYEAAMKGSEEATTSTGNVLEKAVEAAQSQSEASTALADAASALAEEEEVRGSCCCLSPLVL